MDADRALRSLCDASEALPEQPVRAEVDGAAYAVFNLDGAYYVTQDVCTHGPGLLSEGTVLGDEVECPFHQGRFNVRTGAPTLPPCTEAVRVWTAHVIDGRICIDPSERK